tara:strand:- start:4797 stop:5126 length:330 start_codon:yes stop_codon:yes gene_type:complete
MSKFFESEQVKMELKDIQELQRDLYEVIIKFPYMSDEAKVIHIDSVIELLEKQQIMWTRISLSDDPLAVEMKKGIQEGSSQLGFGDADMSMIFSNMRQTLEQVQKSLKK